MGQLRNGVLVLALMGGLAACSDDQASRDAVADEAKQTTSAAPARDCEAVAYDRDLAAGCWAIRVRGLPDSPLAELDLPAGFRGNDAWVWVNADKPDDWGAITLASVGAVYPDPCARGGNPPKSGSSVEDFARAITAQKVTTTTTPVPVSVDGHEGVYLEASVPAGFHLGSCPGEELILWEAGEESPGLDASFVSRYWVLDVDGQRVVLVVNTNARATEATVARFTRIAESATFATG